MEKREYSDRAGRRLVLRTGLTRYLSVSAPGEGGFVFICDLETARQIRAGLDELIAGQDEKSSGDSPASA
jgi:hypothetical protein